MSSKTVKGQGSAAGHEGMVRIPGGTFSMGSNGFYPEERPVRRQTVEDFWIDRHPVTNAEFGRFVDRTGYVTVAERPPDPIVYPDADPSRGARFGGVQEDARPRKPARPPRLVGLRARR